MRIEVQWSDHRWGRSVSRTATDRLGKNAQARPVRAFWPVFAGLFFSRVATWYRETYRKVRGNITPSKPWADGPHHQKPWFAPVIPHLSRASVRGINTLGEPYRPWNPHSGTTAGRETQSVSTRSELMRSSSDSGPDLDFRPTRRCSCRCAARAAT